MNQDSSAQSGKPILFWANLAFRGKDNEKKVQNAVTLTWVGKCNNSQKIFTLIFTLNALLAPCSTGSSHHSRDLPQATGPLAYKYLIFPNVGGTHGRVDIPPREHLKVDMRPGPRY